MTMERQDVERAFRDFCLDNGFSLIPPPEADGEVHRFDSIDSRGKPRRKGAWYKLFPGVALDEGDEHLRITWKDAD